MTTEDRRRLDEVFARFQAEFSMWTESHPVLWELLAFVQYEGIDLPIIREAAPLIKGLKCVSLHGARWCMLAVGDDWHFGLDHEDLEQPVDLTRFRRKELERTLSQKWNRLLLKNNPCG